LRAGTTLDGIGGHTCYGLIENVPATGADGLPITLAHDVTLIRDIAPDQPIRMSDIAIPDGRLDFTLYREGSQKAPSERRVPEDLLVKGTAG
jgi:predicted homoserine dehydrogenase-like protein